MLTVHDPITHSGQEWMEKDRLYAFKCCNHFILLSDVLKESFSEKYKIDYNHISLTRMGEFDYLNNIPMTRPVDNSKYILFFGSITRHKGLDYLLKAMILVHEKCPDLKLVIAGRGKLYFDFSPYKKQDFIVTIFRYVGIQEMVELFRNCEFAVCPYNDATQSGVVQTAFSMNTPIVATNVGALPLSIKDGVTGIIVPPRDVESLAEAIIDLSQNRIKISSFKKNIEKYCVKST